MYFSIALWPTKVCLRVEPYLTPIKSVRYCVLLGELLPLTPTFYPYSFPIYPVFVPYL